VPEYGMVPEYALEIRSMLVVLVGSVVDRVAPLPKPGTFNMAAVIVPAITFLAQVRLWGILPLGRATKKIQGPWLEPKAPPLFERLSEEAAVVLVEIVDIVQIDALATT